MASVLLYTCADRAYQDFIPLFAFSAAALDARFVIEVGVEDALAFREEHGAALLQIEGRFGAQRVICREVAWTDADGRRLSPNVVRFVTPPVTPARYLYISDVDLLFLNRRVINQHIKKMREWDLPYSNSVRPGTQRLSGMHFTRRDAYLPLPDISDIDLRRLNDEVVLYEIVRRRGWRLQDQVWSRPFPGIHISPNREAEASVQADRRLPGWNIGPNAAAYRELAATEDFRALRPLLSPRIQAALARIDEAVGWPA